jgi:hypothetical protein
MEDFQAKWFKVVDYDLSESGVNPLSVDELLKMGSFDREEFFSTKLDYPATMGSRELRENIAALHPGASIDNVLVTVGGIQANYYAFRTLLNPGDELVVMLPNYMQLPGLAHNYGVDVKPFYLKEERGWAPDLNQLEEMVSEETKCIAVCNPNNPTGYILTEEEMSGIVQVARSTGTWLLCDEVYRGAERSGKDTATFWGRYEKVITTGSLSKAYGLPGLRIGWVVGPSEAIGKMDAQQAYITISATMLANKLAALALSPTIRPKLLKRTRKYIKDGFSVFQSWSKEQNDLFTMVDPQAGAFAFPSYELDISSLDLVSRLAQEKSVLVVTGSHFGLRGDYLRISFGLPEDELHAGLSRITQFVAKVRK